MYLMVLATAMVVFAIGASALLSARVQSRIGDLDGDFARARAGAESAIDLGMSMIARQADWRSARANGAWFNGLPFDGGSIGLFATDGLDGDLANDVYEPFQLTGACNRGSARYLLEVTLQQQDEALEALEAAIHCGGGATVNLLTTLTVNGAPLSSNQGVSVLGAVSGSVEAAGAIVGLAISGSATSGVPQKRIPTAVEMAAALDPLATSLTFDGGIENGVIARAMNSLGAANKHGVYKVVANTKNFRIRNLRTLSTLIIDAGNGTVDIEQQVFMSPWRKNLPALIILGNAQINLNGPGTLLSESTAGANLNPPGAPYLSITDSDQSDSYPNQVQGVIYVSGNLTLTGQSTIRGCIIVGGSLTVGSLLGGAPTVHHDPTLTADPPLGFTAVGPPRVVPGSWRRVLTAPNIIVGGAGAGGGGGAGAMRVDGRDG